MMAIGRALLPSLDEAKEGLIRQEISQLPFRIKAAGLTIVVAQHLRRNVKFR